MARSKHPAHQQVSETSLSARGNDDQGASSSQKDTISLARDQRTMLDLLGELSGEVAHEINNPLFVMSGRLRQLAKLSEKGLLSDEKVHLTTKSITEHVNRLNQVTQALLDFSRSMGAQTDCQVGAVFDSLELKLQPTFKTIGARFAFSGDRGAVVGCGSSALLLVLEEVLRAMLAGQIAAATAEAPPQRQDTCSVRLHAQQTDHQMTLSIRVESQLPLQEFLLVKTNIGEPECFERNLARLCLRALAAQVHMSFEEDTVCVNIIFPKAPTVANGSGTEPAKAPPGKGLVKAAG